MASHRTAARSTYAARRGTHSFKNFGLKFYRDWSLHLAQALAFSLITALVPVFILLLAITGSVLGSLSASAHDKMIGDIQHALPFALSKDFLTSAATRLSSSSTLLLVIAIVTAIFFGSRLFTLMEVCFDIIYRSRPRPQLKKNLVAIGMLFLFVILIPILIVVSTVPELVLAYIQHTTFKPNTDGSDQAVWVFASLLVSFIFFEIIYAIVPNRQGSFGPKLSTSWMGALVAAIILQLGLLFFPYYARNFTNGYVGQVGFVLILLAFFYLMALVLLLGAEVNAYFAADIGPASSDLITRASRNN